MKKRINRVIFWLMACICFCLIGCGDSGTNPSVKKAPAEYDFDSGEDYTFKMDLKGYTDYSVYIGDTRLDKTEYTCDEESGEFRISSYSLMYLTLDETYEFKVQTGGGSAAFSVKMVSKSNLSMDTQDVDFDYADPKEIVINADFGDQAIADIRLGAKDYADADSYTYSEKDKTLTFSVDLLKSLSGTTNVLVRLENGKEFSFNINSTLLALADFENEDDNTLLTGQYGMFWGASITQSDDGKDGKAGLVKPEYDHLFVFGGHYWGTMGGVAFEKGESYQVEFDVKPEASSTEKTLDLYMRKAFDSYDPRCGIDPAGDGDDVQKYYTLDLSGGDCKGDGSADFVEYEYDAKTGYTHVTVTFKASSSYDVILNLNTGSNYYDGDRPGESGASGDPTNAENIKAREAAKSVAWLFDNISVIKLDK